VKRSITFYVEIIRTSRWPYIGVGKMFKRRPLNGHAGVLLTVKLEVPSDILQPSVTIVADIPDPQPVEGTAST
jgi:hypothetical protein